MLFIPLLSSGVRVGAERSGDYLYLVRGNTAAIIDAEDSLSGAVKIPQTLDGYPVTRIRSAAFFGCNKITDVTLPEGVTVLEAGTFRNCFSLERVTLPESLTTIEGAAFLDCLNLKYFFGGENLTEVAYGALNGTAYCRENNDSGIVYFKGFIVKVNENLPSNVTIRNGTKSIPYFAFGDHTEITSVRIPDSVVLIDTAAFEGCTNLADVSVGDGVSYVGTSAFRDTAFYNDEKNWDEGLLYLGHLLIGVDRELSGTIKVKDGTRVIGNFAFARANMTAVELPDSLTHVGFRSFTECGNITEITFPENVVSLERDALDRCGLLKQVTVKGKHTALGEYPFNQLTLLQKISGREDSEAEKYAYENGIPFEYLPEPFFPMPNLEGLKDGDSLPSFIAVIFITLLTIVGAMLTVAKRKRKQKE